MVVDLSNLWMHPPPPPLYLPLYWECVMHSDNATTGTGSQFQLNNPLYISLEAMNRYICGHNLGDSYSTGPLRYENFNGNDV